MDALCHAKFVNHHRWFDALALIMQTGYEISSISVPVISLINDLYAITRGQSNLTKSASRWAHSPVRGHPRGSKVVPLNSWGRVSY